MAKAIGSSINLLSLENILALEYYECVNDIIENEKLRKLSGYEQHCHTDRFQHSINVSYYSFLICRFFDWDYRSAARAGLMHDFYFYDWRTTKIKGTNHAAWHPRVACDNARKISDLNDIEEDAILKHMWPCTIRPPKYKESYVVTFSDKICAFVEVIENQTLRLIGRKKVL